MKTRADREMPYKCRKNSRLNIREAFALSVDLKKQNCLIMNQPELGIRIAELRIENSMTQKELADLCTIDIRTIQRIEAGEVVPRMHTLKLLSTALGFDLSQFNSNDKNHQRIPDNKMRLSLIAGIIYSLNAIPVVFYLVTNSLNAFIYFLSITIHIITTIFFFRGFYFLGKSLGNMVLAVSAFATAILLPLVNLIELLKSSLFKASYPATIASVIFTLLCLNSISFGVGLLIEANNRQRLFKLNPFTIAGILTIIQSILFLTVKLKFSSIGLVISLVTNVFLVAILYRTYKNRENGAIKTSHSTALAW
jgi:transcriptional regulator with XRE-family HTH domain